VILDIPPDPLLAAQLGDGEGEVIALGYQRNARLVLVDERRARRIARQAYKLNVRGTAGILIAAKRAELIIAVRPLLGKMIAQGYYISQRLFDRACLEANE
jgi:hypothetical protein